MSSNLLKADSAKKNFTFQLLYQVIILVVPLFVSPYLTRTLGSSALGSYTYNHSIAYYFVIVAQLGISKHGQRVIAQNKHDFTTLRKTYWSLFWTHALMSLLALAAYIIYMIFICASDKAIVYALSLYVLSAFFDITWFFYGIEKFKSISIRNAIVKAVETVLIFSLIKSPADILIYTIIISASVCAGQIIMLPRVIKEIPPIKVGFSDMLAHMKPMIILFSASVAVVLYTVLDKTLLGILSVKDNVAFYEYSNKLINIPKTLINVVSIVLYPKACIYAKNNDF